MPTITRRRRSRRPRCARWSEIWLNYEVKFLPQLLRQRQHRQHFANRDRVNPDRIGGKTAARQLSVRQFRRKSPAEALRNIAEVFSLHQPANQEIPDQAIENPADRGEFRVFNQFTESFSVREMAAMVKRVCPTRVDIAEGLANPRVEHEEHYFHAANTKLLDLGLQPHLLTDEVIAEILQLIERHRDRVDVRAIAPTVQWLSSASTLTTADDAGESGFLAV